MHKVIEVKPLLIEFSSDWINPFKWKIYNWVDFRFVKVYVEWEKMLGAVEAEVCLLGLGLRVRYTYDDDTEVWREIKEAKKKFEEKIEA